MKNLLLALCLMILSFAAPMMSVVGSGQVQTTLQSAKTGNVIFASTSAPIIAIVYSGSITLTTTVSFDIGQDYSLFGKERTCTFTMQFSNLTLVGGLVDDPNILTGTLNTTLSYVSDWTLIPQSQHGYEVSIDPSSGHTSGSVDAAVHGTYDVDHVVFWFSPLEPHLEGNFPATITVTDNNCQPPISNAFQYVVVNPYEDAMLAINKIYCYEEINSSTPCVSQHITVNGVCPVFEALTAQYTCDLALTVESIQSASLAVVTERSGIVEISRAREGTWENVVVGTVLKNSDHVRTGSNGQAKVGFKDGSYLILGSDSSFTVWGIEDPTLWDLMQGKYYFVVNLLQQWIVKKFEVRTPRGGGAVRGTEFTVEVAEDNATTFTVLEGVVDVQDRTSGSNVSLATNQTLTIPQVPGGLTPQEMSALITEVNPASVDRWWISSTPTYSLTIESSTGGSTDPHVETYTQDAGTTLAVTAYPDNGYTLDHWLSDGADAGNSNPITITFNSDHTLQPIFTQGGIAQYTLTVQTQLSGSQNAIPISLSESDIFQLSVAAGQVTGTGSGQGTISVSPSWTSPISVQFTNTYNVTGMVDENGNASIDITEVTTNALPVIYMPSETPGMTHIVVASLIFTDDSRNYRILLQNGYQETVPFPTDYRQIQGQAVITVGGTGPSTRTVGVNQGDWAQYNVSMGAYGGTIPPDFVEVQSGNLSVTSVSGSNVALSILAQCKDGTSNTMAFQIDVNTGEATSGPNFFLIAAGLGAGEDENNFKMNGTSTWQYNGQDRPTVYSNSTLGDYIWDQTTGLLIYAKLPQYSEGSITLDATMTLQLVDTNAFGAITPHTLTIQSSTGGSTNPTGMHTQNAGTTLTVTATPNNNYTFANWLLDGANAGNSNPITITFNSDHTLQPVFTQGGQPPTRTVGVNQGDWAQYSASWAVGAPSSLSDITGIKVTVGEISGTTLTISLTAQFNNGTTTPSSQFTLDVNTGQGGTTTGLNTGVIASRLNQGDLVFTSPQSPLPNAQVADVTTWTQNGFNRTAVHFKSDTLGEYYWDRNTGILLYAKVPVYSGTSTPVATATLTLTSTNRFSGGSVPGDLPTSLLPLIAGAVAVVIGLIVAAVALRRHRRKKCASPLAETVEPGATLATPPKAVEPRTPAGKKFAFCPECGEKLPDLNAKFCPFCGARLDLPGTNAKTGAETLEAAPKGKAGTISEAEKKLGHLKNAKTAKHGWKLKIVASLLIIAIAINTVYRCSYDRRVLCCAPPNYGTGGKSVLGDLIRSRWIKMCKT